MKDTRNEETIYGRAVRLFIENPWHWIGFAAAQVVGVVVFDALLPLGHPIAASAFGGVLVLYILSVPRMTVYGRTVGIESTGALYRRWKAKDG